MANNFWKIRNLRNAIFEKVKLGGAWAPPNHLQSNPFMKPCPKS